jgi:hypothetical protein
MYARTITQRIVELQAHGFTATETQKALKEEYSINIGINTVYRHRKSSVGQEIIDELIAQQERDILKSDAEDREVAMRYRNELLKILIPERIEAYVKQDITKKEIRIVAPWKNKNIENSVPQPITT